MDDLKTNKNLTAWTGLPSFQCFHNIEYCVKNLSSAQETLDKLKTPVHILIVLVLVRIKVNLTFEQMSVIFDMASKKISQLFEEFLPILRTVTGSAIFWPNRQQNLKNLPKCFQPKFTDCQIICDCSEVPIEKPRTLTSQIKSYSNYKGIAFKTYMFVHKYIYYAH